MKSYSNYFRYFSGLFLFILFCQTAFGQDIVINEFLASNTKTNTSPDFGKYDDWIELKNNTNSDLNIGGYYLTDNAGEPYKWQIPANIVIPAKGFYLCWADDGNTSNHTNFKLGKDGEFLGLFTSSGAAVDTLTFGNQSDDISYGRTADNINVWAFFTTPTPGGENISDVTGISTEPEFSPKGGFYTGAQTVIITAGGSLTTIRYTTDGTPPTESSALYTGPLTISATTALRARAFEPNKTPGEVHTATYFINEPINLPVFSLVTDPANFFSDTSGIYVTGTNGITGNCDINTPRNVNQDWERPVHLEFFETDGDRKLSQDAGVKIFGGCSRTRYPQKSLALFARSIYGKGSFDYRFFDDKNIDKFETFVLRSSADDQVSTMFRDGAAATILSQDPDAIYQSYRPAVVYLNGVYWGIHNIREKINEHFLVSNFNINEDDITLLEYSSSETPIIMQGTTDEYNAMINYIKSNDMSNEANYNYVKTLMDVEQFINYQIGHIQLAEEDWPHGNVRFWKAASGNYSKWHWINYDMDGSLYSYKIGYDKLKMAIGDSVSWQNPEWSTVILKNLLENTSFKNLFIQRYAYLLSTIFEPNRVIAVIDSIQNTIAPEIPRHITKWGGQKDPECDETWINATFSTVEEWEKNVKYMRDFAEQRPVYAIQHILDNFDLSGTAVLAVNPNINGAGKLKVTGMTIPDSGYSGTYFQGIPVTVEAVAGYGYKFSHWKSGNLTFTDPELSLIFSSDYSVTAYFVPAEVADSISIVINEINYNSSSEYSIGDWVELYNRNSEDVNLSYWMLKDENDDNVFTIPDGTIIKAHGYLVLCSSSNDFNSLVPDVTNYTGDFSFGFSSKGELVRLFSSNGILIDSVRYNNKLPWPEDADGNGSTLELINTNLDNDLAANWTAAIGTHGTPGVQNSTISDVAETEDNNVPGSFELLANYPNPFNPVTNIGFRIPEAGRVVLKIYDVIGREVATLVDEERSAGEYRVQFDAASYASGVYYYQLRTQNNIQTRKMMLLK
jgi:hypothetical protein